MENGANIEFWFDFSSNYSYLAAMRIEALAAPLGVAVQWRPFLLGPVFQAMGWQGSPLLAFEAKARYVWRDMPRRCARHGLPWTPPSVFPRRALLPARIASFGADLPWIGGFCRSVMHANFADDRDIDEAPAMSRILAALGLPAQEILAAAVTGENRLLLRQRTDEAMRRGVFGAPTFFVGEEMFWGDDRLEDALEWAVAPGQLDGR